MKKLLFTTLPSNDLGLLTRSLPIATELAQRGYEIIYCSPAKAPSKLIAEAGFDNSMREFGDAVYQRQAKKDGNNGSN
ncbi:MAG: hypothetical protein JXM69_04530 [Anaerolineae bacterium]|nr:hypothetical protein [Anaerolineae bacterium]